MNVISSGRLIDEKLMEIALGTLEDINQTLSREEDVRKGNNPKKFTSFFENNKIEINKKYSTYKKEEKKFSNLNPINNFNKNEENENHNNKNNNIK